MPRSFPIHPTSLALGLALASLCFLSMSQTMVSTPLRVEYVAHPRDYFRIEGGTPYVVPAGKVLVLAGVGKRASQLGSTVTIFVNNLPEHYSQVALGHYVDLPRGLTHPAGTTILTADGYAVSYLVNQ